MSKPHTPVRKNQSGLVLLSVLLMLAIGSLWASYAWQQAFSQQRMMQHQTHEVLAWQAAEAGGMHLWHQSMHTVCPNSGGAFMEGSPGTRWRIGESLQSQQDCSLWVVGEVLDTSSEATQVVSQAHLLLEITEKGEPLQPTIQRWQRVYPR